MEKLIEYGIKVLVHILVYKIKKIEKETILTKIDIANKVADYIENLELVFINEFYRVKGIQKWKN